MASPRSPLSDDSYALVLERRVLELETCDEASRDARERLESECAALRAECAALRASTKRRPALGDVTNAATTRSETTPMRNLKSQLRASDEAAAAEVALRMELAKARAAAAKAEASTSKAVAAERELAADNERWLQSALRAKCTEIERLSLAVSVVEKRASDLDEALSTSESRLRDALEELDGLRSEAKSAREKYKTLRDKYKSLKRDRTELELALERAASSGVAPPSPTWAVALDVLRVLERASPVAAAFVAALNFFSFLLRLRARRLTITTQTDPSPVAFVVSGFARWRASASAS